MEPRTLLVEKAADPGPRPAIRGPHRHARRVPPAVVATPQTHRSALAYPPVLPGFERGEGVYLYDADGIRYLDAEAGTFNVPLGYRHSTVTQAVQESLDSGVAHQSSSTWSDYVEAAAKALVSVAPDHLNRVHFKGCTGGSTAVEQAIRHCWAVTRRRTIVAFRGGHHGQTIATTAVSGMPFRRNRLPVVSLPVVHVDPPNCYRCPVGREPSTCKMQCLDEVRHALDHPPTGEGDVAAFVAEPILGAGGGITPPKAYWPELHALLRARGIPLVLDEVQSWARTGFFFAAQYFNLQPDFIALAKGISGIGLAGSGALLLPASAAVLDPGERSLTGGAANYVCAAIAATIKVMRKPSFFATMMSSARVLAEGLAKIQRRFDCVGIVRGIGLMTGVEIVRSRQSRESDPALANHIVEKALEHGLILRTSEYGRGGFVKVRPPLVISTNEVHELLDKLEFAIESALGLKLVKHSKAKGRYPTRALS